MPRPSTLKNPPSERTAYWVSLAASGVLLALTLPPANLFLLTFVGFTPWLFWARTQPIDKVVRSSWWMGLFYFVPQMAWLFGFANRWTGNVLLSLLPVVISVSILVLYFVAFGWIVGQAFARKQAWVIPIAWAGMESFRSFVPVLAFPHGVLAGPLWVEPMLTQLAAFGTVELVSAWVMLASTALVEIGHLANIRTTARFVVVFGALGLLSAYRSTESPLETQKLQVCVGQIGEDLAYGDPNTEPQRVADAIAQITEQAEAQGADLLVFPEGLFKAGNQFPPTPPFVLGSTPTIVGGQREDAAGKFHQSTFLHENRTWQVVDKTRLVIFGEFVPMRDQLPFLKNFRLTSGDLEPGSRVGTLTSKGVRFGPLICFEAMFGDIAYKQCEQGAQVLVVQSIDDWYLGTSMPDQLLSATAYRSVESGLPLIRAASLGISGVFDARGRMIARAPVGTQAALPVTISVPPASDAFRYRFWFPIFSVVFFAAYSLYCLVQKSRDPAPASE